MNRNILRKKFIEIIATAIEEYGLSPLSGWIEGVLTLENRELTQKDISEKLSEILSEEHFPTSLTSVNRALKSMERNNLIVKKGSRKKGYTYTLNQLSGIPIGFFQKILTVNIQHLDNLQKFKKEIGETEDKSLLNAIEYQVNFSEAIIKYFRQLLDGLKQNHPK